MLMETVVKKFGNSLGVSLPASLREGRNIDVGSHVDIVESDSDLVITVRGNKKKLWGRKPFDAKRKKITCRR
jgi:antitoxin component of MazEF toxin-antitoxin module